MSTKISVKQAIPILGNSVGLLFKNPKILYPFGILAFIQLFLMEVLFFANRSPLVIFFGRIISRIKGSIYLHYPYNFDLMNHWFQASQVFIFLVFSSLLIAKAIMMVAQINNGEEIGDKMPKIGLRCYINVVISFLLIFLVMYGLTSLYGILIHRALQIRSTSGKFFLIKQTVLMGAPYFNLVFSVFVTTFLAYLVPLVVLGKKNVFIALVKNLQIIWPSFWAILIFVACSSALYIPILLVRSNHAWFSTFMTSESWQVFIIFSVFLMLLIDAVQYTAITICYLLTKDE